MLIEEEKVRTLSRSTAQITFHSYDDFLRYDPASQSYRATVVVPGAAASAPAALEHVELEDYAGNRKRYTFY